MDLTGLRSSHGSTLNVNANTRLRIDFTAQVRNIYLEQGQLYIDVAPNKEHPLVVHAGDAQIKVVGTGFDVRRSQRQLEVSVAHGQVAICEMMMGNASANSARTSVRTRAKKCLVAVLAKAVNSVTPPKNHIARHCLAG